MKHIVRTNDDVTTIERDAVTKLSTKVTTTTVIRPPLSELESTTTQSKAIEDPSSPSCTATCISSNSTTTTVFSPKEPLLSSTPVLANGSSIGKITNNFIAVGSDYDSCCKTSRVRRVVLETQEQLKYDVDADRAQSDRKRSISTTSETTTATARRRRRRKLQHRSNNKRLSFDETVKVMPIPMRTEYSHRVRSRLWSSAVEIHQNATRNAVEFAAEGWDWRQVTEDEKMLVCVATGELIHPCHCDTGELGKVGE